MEGDDIMIEKWFDEKIQTMKKFTLLDWICSSFLAIFATCIILIGSVIFFVLALISFGALFGGSR